MWVTVANILAFYDTVVKSFVVKAQAEDQTWSEFSTLEVSAHMIETFVRFLAKRYSLMLKTWHSLEISSLILNVTLLGPML